MQTSGNLNVKVMAPNIPTTMKAAVAEKAGADLTIKDVPVPQLQEGEILIKVIACGVCHSDEAVRQGLFGELFPRIPGHEIVGDVVAVGPHEKKWKVGDRVGGAWHGGHDGTCKQCNKGYFQMCDNEQINGVSRDGGYAEYCPIRSEAAVEIAKDVDPYEMAPLLCAGVTVFNSVRHMDIEHGGTVAIHGLGGLGHLALQYVRKMGYRTVALSSSDAKKDFAMKLGATDYFDGSKEDHAEALQKLGGADCIVVTAPNPELIPKLINGLAPRGTLLILAPVGDVSVNTVAMIGKGLKVRAWPSGHGQDSTEAIEFAREQGVHCMIEKSPLSDVNKALKRCADGSVRFRGVLTF